MSSSRRHCSKGSMRGRVLCCAPTDGSHCRQRALCLCCGCRYVVCRTSRYSLPPLSESVRRGVASTPFILAVRSSEPLPLLSSRWQGRRGATITASLAATDVVAISLPQTPLPGARCDVDLAATEGTAPAPLQSTSLRSRVIDVAAPNFLLQPRSLPSTSPLRPPASLCRSSCGPASPSTSPSGLARRHQPLCGRLRCAVAAPVVVVRPRCRRPRHRASLALCRCRRRRCACRPRPTLPSGLARCHSANVAAPQPRCFEVAVPSVVAACVLEGMRPAAVSGTDSWASKDARDDRGRDSNANGRSACSWQRVTPATAGPRCSSPRPRRHHLGFAGLPAPPRSLPPASLLEPRSRLSPSQQSTPLAR